MNATTTVRNRPGREFTFRRSGDYTNAAPLPRPLRARQAASGPRLGAVCRGCGCARSLTNRCECNS